MGSPKTCSKSLSSPDLMQHPHNNRLNGISEIVPEYMWHGLEAHRGRLSHLLVRSGLSELDTAAGCHVQHLF